MAKSATAFVLEKLPNILDDKGKTFWTIWDLLVHDKELAPMLFDAKKQPRYGVLQGISTRIKADKIPGLSIARVGGESMWFATDNELDIWARQVELAVSQVNSLPLPSNIEDKSQQEIVVKLSTLLKASETQVSKLKDIVSKTAEVKANALVNSKNLVEAPKTPANKFVQDKNSAPVTPKRQVEKPKSSESKTPTVKNSETDKSKQVADAKDKTETKPSESKRPIPAKSPAKK